jgi:hypothetical protein
MTLLIAWMIIAGLGLHPSLYMLAIVLWLAHIAVHG